MNDRNPPPELPVLRELPAAEVAAFLRSLVGLPPADHQGTEVARRPVPGAVDVVSWIAWAQAGLYACALPEREDDREAKPRGPWAPPIRTVVAEARRVAIVIAMHRNGGNLSRAATALKTSRRALRDALKRAGLYPWPGMIDDGHDDASTTKDDAATGGE